MTAYGNQAIAYNSYGMPTTYRGQACTYTRGTLLASMGGNSFTYDADGLRLSKNNTNYTYIGGKLMQEVGTRRISFGWGSDGIMGIECNDTSYFFRKNAFGDVTHIYDANGTLHAKYIYDAWGNHQVETFTDSNIGNINPIRYRGYYYDTETKLYYLKARYYDPETGRFISQDNVSYLDPDHVMGLNLYLYCNNNPVMGYDPDGTWDWGSFWRGVGYVVTGVSAVVAGALVIASGVALAPMIAIAAITVIAGGLTAVNGVSEIVAAGTGYNFVKDTVFGGNSSAYNTYATITGTVATIGSIICGSWYKYNTPRIQAYKNIENYNFSKTLSDSTHLARPYQHSALLQRNIIKYGEMVKESSSIYTFTIEGAYKIGWVSYGIGNAGSNPVTWKLVVDIAKQIIFHAGF